MRRGRPGGQVHLGLQVLVGRAGRRCGCRPEATLPLGLRPRQHLHDRHVLGLVTLRHIRRFVADGERRGLREPQPIGLQVVDRAHRRTLPGLQLGNGNLGIGRKCSRGDGEYGPARRSGQFAPLAGGHQPGSPGGAWILSSH
ncbi:MAG: hypothetical protein WCB96_08440 [Candidatus Aminicenantales bacterium]